MQRCLLLVNFDIDAICACRILQQLFKNDNILYTLVPVQGIQDMVQAIEENCEEVSIIFLCNLLISEKQSNSMFLIGKKYYYDKLWWYNRPSRTLTTSRIYNIFYN